MAKKTPVYHYRDTKRRVNKLRTGLHMEHEGKKGETINHVASRIYGRQLQEESVRGHKRKK